MNGKKIRLSNKKIRLSNKKIQVIKIYFTDNGEIKKLIIFYYLSYFIHSVAINNTSKLSIFYFLHIYYYIPHTYLPNLLHIIL